MKNNIGGYKCIRLLGKGHFASVLLAKSPFNELVAIKVLQRQGISKNQLHNIENEVIALKIVNHLNVIAMTDRLKSKSSYYLILEYSNGGDLQ
jgi:serine/threonine protein kinase